MLKLIWHILLIDNDNFLLLRVPVLKWGDMTNPISVVSLL